MGVCLRPDPTISSPLAVPTPSHFYDKKFCTQTLDDRGFNKALVPQVMTAARTYLWTQLMQRVKEDEQNLLEVCARATTLNIASGQLREHGNSTLRATWFGCNFWHCLY